MSAGALGWLSQIAGAKVAAALVAGATAAGGLYLALPAPDTEPQVAAPPAATEAATPPDRPTRPERRASPPAAAQPTARFSTAPPSPSSTGLVPLGAVVIRPAGDPGRTFAQRDGKVLLLPTPSATPADSTFTVVAGLADATCYSLRFADGRYIRHSSFRLVLGTGSDSLFRQDATFCARPVATGGDIRLQSFNYRDRYVHRRGDEIWLDPDADTDAFRGESSFVLAPLPVRSSGPPR